MSLLSVVPAALQTPLVRPKRVDWTPEGLATHTESMRLYDLAVARRFASARLSYTSVERPGSMTKRFTYVGMKKYRGGEDDDVVVDVGGEGESYVYRQLSTEFVYEKEDVVADVDVARRLDYETEDTDEEDVEDDDDEDEESVYEGEYEVDSDYEYEEEEEKEPMTYALEKMSHTEFHQSMEQECPLCLEELKREVCVTTSCKHSFCTTCYEKYTKRSCPCCRQYVDTLTTYCLEDSQT